MRNRARHSNSPIDRLRLAIDCLPLRTREAMLDGVRASERIIVGAYVDELGGVCPMLAAHRCGGRTDFLSFAKSWDRFTRAKGSPRAASTREVRILLRQLEDSLLQETGSDLDAAICEHRELVGRSRGERRRLRDQADPRGEIIARRLGATRVGRVIGDKLARRPVAGAGAL
ncbi:MAG TPA: hypothetical protein VGN13_12570 [Solirubrobacteraceae bacterium]|jgi:hypothetical protein